MDEKNLILRAKNGDHDAFAVLVEESQGKIYNLTLRMTGNPDDAAELTQEAYLNAWRGLKNFQGDSSFSTWVYRLASNACIDFLRREKRRKDIATAVSIDDDGDEGRQLDLPDQTYDPHRQSEQRELKETLAAGLLTLSEEHRKVLVLREVEGLSYSEIAEILQLGEGTVKSRISRARLALRKYLIGTGNFSDYPSSTKEKKPPPD